MAAGMGALGAGDIPCLSLRAVWRLGGALGPPRSPPKLRPWPPRERQERRGPGRAQKATDSPALRGKSSKSEALSRLGQATEVSRGLVLLAWPFLVHKLFQLTDKLNALESLFGRNLSLRVLAYVGSALWLMNAALATDFRFTTRPGG